MPKNIYEKHVIKPEAHLEGRPKEGFVVFEYWKNHDEKLLASNKVEVPAEESVTGVKDSYEAPLVADDEESYPLTVVVKCDGDVKSSKEYVVWPRTGIIESVDEKDEMFPFFAFKVKQDGALSDDKLTKGTTGKSLPFDLEKGKGFKIVAKPPFKILKERPRHGRRRKVTVEQKFKVEILAPDQHPRQYVNLPTATNGQDGKGNRVRVVLGVEGDGDSPPDAQIANQRISCFVEVVFRPANGAQALSKRNNPVRGLREDGSNGGMSDLVDLEEVEAGKHCKAKVYFGSALDGRNVGIFEIELGHAGGDLCELKVGSTDACGDASRTFESWRRIYYELLTVDFMNLNDFPGGVRDHLKAVGAKIFVDIVLDQAVVKTPASAEKHTVFRREFMGKKKGADLVHVIKPSIDKAQFTLAKQPQQVGVALADYVVDVLKNAAEQTIYVDDVKDAEVKVYLQSYVMWVPDRELPNGNLTIDWDALVDKKKVSVPATLTLLDGSAATEATDTTRAVHVTDGKVGEFLVFEKGTGKSIPTSLSSEWQDILKRLVESDWCDERALRACDGAVTLTVSGKTDTEDDQKRVEGVKKLLQKTFDKLKPGLPKHPGLDSKGRPRDGTLDASIVDLDRSTKHKIVLRLPSGGRRDPGTFVGKMSAEKCPLRLKLKFKAHETLGGFSLRNTLVGAVALEDHDELVVAETLLHEIGHKMAMTVTGANAAKKAPGLPAPKTVDEKGAAYPKNGEKGHVYTEHGHTGPHCAYGLSDDDKTGASYNVGPLERKATCIMFGVVDQKDGSKRPHFCDECVEHIRARNLGDLSGT